MNTHHHKLRALYVAVGMMSIIPMASIAARTKRGLSALNV